MEAFPSLDHRLSGRQACIIDSDGTISESSYYDVASGLIRSQTRYTRIRACSDFLEEALLVNSTER